MAEPDNLIFAARVNGPFLALSPGWEDALGRPLAELMPGDACARHVHPDDRGLVAQWNQDVLTGRNPLPIRTRLEHRSRGYQLFQWDAVPIANANVILGTGHEAGTDPPSSVLQLLGGRLQIDIDARLVYAGDRPLDLTATEFDLLRLLAQTRGSVLDADHIAEAVWGYKEAGSRNFLQAHVSRLRKKLHDAHIEDLIITVRGVGYVIR